MPFQFMGTGTTNYGVSDWSGDTYVTTRWASVVYLPVYPLESYRVKDMGSDPSGPFSRSHQFRIIERLPLQKQQVLVTYGLFYAYALLLAAVMFGLAKHLPLFNSLTAVIALTAPIVGKVVWDRRQRAKANGSPR